MSPKENALESILKLNEFKNTNSEFSFLELKKYLKTIKVKNVSGLTIEMLTSSNICKKINRTKLNWVDSNPINYLQLENAIRLSGLYIKNVNDRHRQVKQIIVDTAETEAYTTPISFWGKIKNFFTK